ncbi:hypothetical protein Gogos_021229 [Gossypium gossypioides]|uniref:Uncharacterized protein n=1 Tax=Gossypium gossypioides TaxID=34282 RepID=A0A7J9D2I4_GOSGO|nr:hypothetical protein [Gossypium gossypioides]
MGTSILKMETSLDPLLMVSLPLVSLIESRKFWSKTWKPRWW